MSPGHRDNPETCLVACLASPLLAEQLLQFGLAGLRCLPYFARHIGIFLDNVTGCVVQGGSHGMINNRRIGATILVEELYSGGSRSALQLGGGGSRGFARRHVEAIR